MAWSAKLVVGDGGVSGFNEFELFFTPGSQEDYKKMYGSSLRAGLPNVTYHTPDSDEPQPALVAPSLSEYYCEFIGNATTYDALLNVIAKLKRPINGPESTAMLHNLRRGTFPPVFFRIQPDGATNWTQFKVVTGIVDDGRALYTPAGVVNTAAYRAVISLTCFSEGRGAVQTLRNDLPSSPHMLHDLDSDGLADGLALVNTPTTSISNSVYLIGDQSQYIEQATPSTAQGVRSENDYSIGKTHYAYAYVWIKPEAETITVTLRNQTDTVDIETKNISVSDQSAADKSTVGPDGNTWYRVVVSGQNTTGGSRDFRFLIFAPTTTTAAACYIDGMFFHDTDSSTAPTIPDAWCSGKTLKNRYDQKSAGDEGQLCYFDVWGVPGDQPARAVLSVTDNNAADRYYISRIWDGLRKAVDYKFMIDSAEFDSTGGSTITDATRHGGNYLEATLTGGAGDQEYDWGAGISKDLAQYRSFFDYDCRMFVVAKVDNSAGADYTPINNVPSFCTLLNADPVNNTNFTDWVMLDLKAYVTTALNDYVDDFKTGASIGFNADGATGVKWQYDMVYLFPQGEFIIAENPSGGFAAELIFDGIEKQVLAVSDAEALDHIGSLWKVQPGVMNRYIIAATNANVHTIGDTFTVKIDIQPRASHLIGTT